MPLPGNLEKVREEALDALCARLNAMCDGADDALFDLSQKAPESEQSLYFDAMRELRLRRPAIVGAFREGVDADFGALAPAAGGAGKAAGKGSFNLDSLSLLGDDELDVSVAFQTMVARTRDQVSTDIDHLAQRLSKVLSRMVEVEQVPLHPARVCEHFRKPSDALPLPLKARLIFYKLFERNVLDFLGDVIAAGNQTLALAGVLPEIKSTRPRPLPSGAVGREKPRADAAKPDGGASGAEKGGGAGVSAADMPGAIAELLTLARSAVAGRLPAGVGQAGGVIPIAQLPAGAIPVMDGGKLVIGNQIVESDVPVQVVPAKELNALLTHLQQLQPAVKAEGDEAGLADVKMDLSGLMKEQGESPRALERVDDDLINLVSMLFDFIMDDPEVPPGVKALLGRLQIPLLKVALLDKAFFKDEQHPARYLLNTLARSAMGWTRESDDGLLAKIDEVVHRILNDFTDNVGLFAELVADFDDFLASRQKRTTLIEARLRDREEGQARADTAQGEVRDAVAERIGGSSLPAEALTLIQEAWQRVLYLTAVRDGTDSELWQQRVKVLEVLVWCAQKQDKPEARLRQKAFVPRLMLSLRKGMTAVGFDMTRGEALIAALEPVLNALAEGAQGRMLRIRTAPVAASASPSPETQARTAVAGDAVQVLERSDEEVVIASRAPEPEKPGDEVDPVWLETADRLGPGSWVEFGAEGETRTRGKVAARIKAQNKFVFVNARGAKIMERAVDQLAKDLQVGLARLISESALFDRALENMVRQLKESRTTTA